MNTNILSFNKCKLDTMWPINKWCLNSNQVEKIFVHYYPSYLLRIFFFCSSHIKIVYTKKYITQKLINKFLNQVEYPI